MVSSEFRLEARKKLEGKWGKVACFTLAYMLIFFVLGFIQGFFEGLFPTSMQFIWSLVVAIIELPLSFGFIISLFKLYNGEEVKAFDFLSLGFSNFKKSWGISLQTALKMIVPIILVIVSYVIIIFGMVGATTASIVGTASTAGSFGVLGIIGFILFVVSMIWATTKSYYYQLAYLVAADNPEMSSKDAVLKSEELMTNKRGKLFCLELSFIGWAILACFTLGIGYLWLLPYIQFATIAFYKFATGNSSDVKAEVVTENSNDPIQGN
ncbi:MAG: DUF975 family protein [Clostridia bacterium]|nr:DUF975 family protein [Clostridia bacterium]